MSESEHDETLQDLLAIVAQLDAREALRARRARAGARVFLVAGVLTAIALIAINVALWAHVIDVHL